MFILICATCCMFFEGRKHPANFISQLCPHPAKFAIRQVKTKLLYFAIKQAWLCSIMFLLDGCFGSKLGEYKLCKT